MSTSYNDCSTELHQQLGNVDTYLDCKARVGGGIADVADANNVAAKADYVPMHSDDDGEWRSLGRPDGVLEGKQHLPRLQ
jgi:hypothetical protein